MGSYPISGTFIPVPPPEDRKVVMTAQNELREKIVSGGYRLDTNEGINRTIDFINSEVKSVLDRLEKVSNKHGNEWVEQMGIKDVQAAIKAERRKYGE